MTRGTTRRPRARSREEVNNEEDDEEETTRRRPPRSRRRDDDEEEEAPRRRSRRSRDEDEDDDEEEAPRRRPRSRRDDDDEDDTPRRGKTPDVSGGWGSYSDKRISTGDWINVWSVPEDETLIKILDAAPFANYRQHWVDGAPKGVRKSYLCVEEECPLCDAGDKPDSYALFNILDLSKPDDPKVEVWRVSPTVGDLLLKYSKEAKTKPINRVDVYWAVSMVGGKKKGSKRTQIQPVKGRDVLEDYDLEPFDEDELEEFKRYTEDDVLHFDSRSKLRDVVEEYLD